MKIVLWVLQVLLALVFLAHGLLLIRQILEQKARVESGRAPRLSG